MIFIVRALRRICPCFVIYLGGTVPALWFLQIDKLDRYNAALSANVSNLTDTLQEALSSIEGVCCTIVKNKIYRQNQRDFYPLHLFIDERSVMDRNPARSVDEFISLLNFKFNIIHHLNLNLNVDFNNNGQMLVIQLIYSILHFRYKFLYTLTRIHGWPFWNKFYYLFWSSVVCFYH